MAKSATCPARAQRVASSRSLSQRVASTSVAACGLDSTLSQLIPTRPSQFIPFSVHPALSQSDGCVYPESRISSSPRRATRQDGQTAELAETLSVEPVIKS